MIWSVEMKLLVDDEVWDVLEVQGQLMKAVSVVDSRPRFVTAQQWMVEQTAALKLQPEATSPGAPGVIQVSGPKRKKGLGRGPQT